MILTPQSFPQVSINQSNNDYTPTIMNDTVQSDWIDDILDDESSDDMLDFESVLDESFDDLSTEDYYV